MESEERSMNLPFPRSMTYVKENNICDRIPLKMRTLQFTWFCYLSGTTFCVTYSIGNKEFLLSVPGAIWDFMFLLMRRQVLDSFYRGWHCFSRIPANIEPWFARLIFFVTLHRAFGPEYNLFVYFHWLLAYNNLIFGPFYLMPSLTSKNRDCLRRIVG